MNRVALSLSLLLVTAPAAGAEGNRSLGLTVSPVGVFAVGIGGSRGLSTGYSANLAWSFDRGHSPFSVGGHLASCLAFTEATPFSVRFTPTPTRRLQPYVGLGASLIVPHPGQDLLGTNQAPIRLGGEFAAGLGLILTEELFLDAQARYQTFPFGGVAGQSRKLDVAAAYLCLGFRL
ncbi:MAG: hypothetical protein ACYC8T_30245 [Myxococcaceae bacterium]